MNRLSSAACLARSALVSLVLAASPPAQGTVVVPELAADLPGNAAISMPLRWSQGRMQVLIERAMLPASLAGRTVQALVLRRPAFLGEPPYPAITRTVVVRAAITPRTAGQLGTDLTANQPGNLAVVAGPTTLQVAASPAHGPGEVLGADLVTIPLATPLALGSSGNLFLEFETQDSGFAVSAQHWIDAVHMQDGVDAGYAVAVGNGGCGSVPAPMSLLWTSPSPPRSGETARLNLTGAVPLASAWILTGLDPQGRPPSAGFLGFGAELVGFGAPGCYQWSPIDVQLAATTSLLGTLGVRLPFPSGLWSAGQRIAVQTVVMDPAASAAGFAFSNGVVLVMDGVGFGPQCATVFAPGAAATAPWPPWRGLLPVLGLRL